MKFAAAPMIVTMTALAVVLLVLPPACSATGTAASTCRNCEKITAWKLYTSGTITKWQVRIPPNTIDTPGYFTRINNGTCVRANRVDPTRRTGTS